MTVRTLEEAKILDIPEDTILQVELISITEREREVKTGERKGEKYDRLNWKFVILDEGEYEDKPIWGDTSPAFNTHPECKLRNWAQALLGVTFPEGYNLDDQDLIGAHGRIVVGRRTYEKDGETRVYNFVADILPPKTGTGGSSPQAVSDTEAYGEEPF